MKHVIDLNIFIDHLVTGTFSNLNYRFDLFRLASRTTIVAVIAFVAPVAAVLRAEGVVQLLKQLVKFI
jgi:hypothetical protein